MESYVLCLRSFFLLTISCVLLVPALLLLTVSSRIVCFVSLIALFIDSLARFASSTAAFADSLARIGLKSSDTQHFTNDFITVFCFAPTVSSKSKESYSQTPFLADSMIKIIGFCPGAFCRSACCPTVPERFELTTH